ncbi:MAG: hypothetical protein LBN39_06220 [Planctomycetaceae bacterium]|jgi:hypothetical protein|nr:hypothetical protein [Planctomycetaceae bacterium]
MKTTYFIQTVCISAILACTAGTAQEQNVSAQPRIAPGVLTTILPDLEYSSVYNRADMVEILATLPQTSPELADDIRMKKDFWAKDVRYQRDIWCLQFSFKPVRFVSVDIPNKEGTLDKKTVWYLVYNVKNLGPLELEKIIKERPVKTDSGERIIEETNFEITAPGSLLGTEIDKKVVAPIAKDTVAKPEDGEAVTQERDAPLEIRNLPGTFQPRPGDDVPVKCVPQFVLAADQLVLETKTANDPETGKVIAKSETASVSYADQVIPLALPAVIKKEGMKAVPETTVSITKKPLKSGESVWGVAMWTDVDPRINRFSIFVSGLTNDYKWTDSTNTGKPGEGRTMQRKVLKTNWLRIGDRYKTDDSQIQYGGTGAGAVDYEWIFL